MAIMKFSDDEIFNTGGTLRSELRSDGWYVIGDGMLIPVSSSEEADKIIRSGMGS